MLKSIFIQELHTIPHQATCAHDAVSCGEIHVRHGVPVMDYGCPRAQRAVPVSAKSAVRPGIGGCVAVMPRFVNPSPFMVS